ncbi:ABC transporter transmembrane domain-containing protein [Methylobacterium sp. P31]
MAGLRWTDTMRELEPRLFPYIWRYSKGDQLKICAVVLASLPFYFASLDLPKRIVNDAITGKAFSHGEATAPFLELTVQWPAALGGGRTGCSRASSSTGSSLLLGLSTLFLSLVLINGAFKFWINLQKGILGERMLRRLRFQLFSLMLRFSPEAQREVKSSETATIIRDEVEPIGSFIGDAIVVPVFLGTQAATALAFIMVQNVWLGLAAGGMVGVQMTVIPRLRREIIRLSRRRQIASRNLAGRVAEVLDGLPAVLLNDTGRWERAEIGGRLYSLYDLRLRIYRRKFAVKYLNNLLAQVTPFLFYAIGGYFALKGELDIGQLVAVLAAYRDLPPPLKELIDWDQQRLDVEVKYETVAAHFGPQRLRSAERELEGTPPRLGSPLRVEGLALRDPQGACRLRSATPRCACRGVLRWLRPAPWRRNSRASSQACRRRPAAQSGSANTICRRSRGRFLHVGSPSRGTSRCSFPGRSATTSSTACASTRCGPKASISARRGSTRR